MIVTDNLENRRFYQGSSKNMKNMFCTEIKLNYLAEKAEYTEVFNDLNLTKKGSS